jgi:hypothetical protein
MAAHAKKRNLFGFGSRTYSARSGEWRKSKKDKKAEARERKAERAEAERERKQSIAEAKKERKEEAAEKRRQAAEDRKERDLKHRMEMREKAEERKAQARRKTASKSSGSGYPALFGTPYEKLSPSQQALVRRASNHRKKNPGRSFADCVKAVSKQKGITSPAAVCAASKMRTAAGKRELMAAAKASRNSGMCPMSGKNPFETLSQGKSRADIFQIGPHAFAAQIGSDRKTFKTYSAAKSWARLRLHEVANPKGFRVRVVPYQPGKRNPFDAAQKLSEEFHGIPSTEVLEIKEKEHYHSNLSGIGPLISLAVLNRTRTKEVIIMAPDPAAAPIEDVVFVTFTEDGRQIIFVGGDQQVDFKPLMNGFGLTDADVRDHMELGEISCVTYRTKKIFEAGGEEEVDFYHELGGEGSKGVLPTLVYKRRNPGMEVVGGRYRIGKFDKELGASPGIIG